ncbi:aspartate aminotransferase [Thermoplasmatales archaeon ex4572_165]|nr:MAG: aspartate aminotransferase [Thermoplasmatales archaeon ex4572_165]RLF57993.1 MAG: pyridoxal phosphate-dependent aminotransferase [Thermoplasmata archaeon]
MHFIGRTSNIRNAPIIKLLQDSKVSKEVISLGQGIPFFRPPENSIESFIKNSSLKNGYSYSTDAGLIELRKAIKVKLSIENNIIVDEEQIVVTAGANQGFMNVIMSITDSGDEIILITPSYFNYIMSTRLVGCKPVLVSSDESTNLPNIEEIKKRISDKTRAIVTISPNNPTGVVYPKNLLKNINDICMENELYHISDEVYEYFTYDNNYHISPAFFDKDMDHTISLFSCSKSFAMSGYRIGCIITPKHLFNEILKVQDTIGICAPVPSQYAAIKAFDLGSSYMNQYISEINEIRLLFYDVLNGLDSVNVNLPQGAMYFFLHLKKEINTWDLAKRLIDEYDIITIPGEVFDSNYSSLRVSFGNLRVDESKEGIVRLKKGLEILL